MQSLICKVKYIKWSNFDYPSSSSSSSANWKAIILSRNFQLRTATISLFLISVVSSISDSIISMMMNHRWVSITSQSLSAMSSPKSPPKETLPSPLTPLLLFSSCLVCTVQSKWNTCDPASITIDIHISLCLRELCWVIVLVIYRTSYLKIYINVRVCVSDLRAQYFCANST